MASRDAPVHHRSAPEAKVALFRSLFRGRDDVYAHRFESRRTGKSGYQPACANEWARGLCAKPKVKCLECPQRRFLPLTDDVVRRHLLGQGGSGRDFVMGIYPMLQDESVFFLAVDFDKAHWQDDVAAVLDTCRRMDLSASLERSRSGNGAHLWFFFEEAVSAALARRLGAHVLTETLDHRPEVGLHSYDRFFPNQDTLPQGGFGNLIALPLQRRPRDLGNSVFLDERYLPHPDQWAYLSRVGRVSRAGAEALVEKAARRGRIVGVRVAQPEEDGAAPWGESPSRRVKAPTITGPLPKRLELILADQIYIPKAPLPPGLRNRLVQCAAFQNPEFYKAQAMRLPTYGTPRIIACAEDYPQHIGLPRGCFGDVEALLEKLRVEMVVHDKRFVGTPLHAEFHGELLPEQEKAAHAMAVHDTGVLSATTAFGKTVVAAWLIAQRGVNTLVLVHRRQLMDQWVERLSTFLGLTRTAIGRMGGGRNRPNGSLDVAVMQSLVRRGEVKDCVAGYGHLVVDECHHVSARSFELVVRRAKAKFVTGLSATVTRKDGRHPIILMQCGPVRHRVDAKAQAASRPFRHLVLVRPTAFRPAIAANPDARIQFHDLYRELIADRQRNDAICGDIVEAVREGRSPLVLTERNEHLDELAARLSPVIRHVVVLRGGAGKKITRATSDRLATILDGEERVLLATGRYIGEGFDDARLDTLFLTLPVSWRGTIAQYAGRLHRLHHRKREVRVVDYADLNVPMLARMFDRRCRGYEAVGYTIVLPASAIPGWPVEAPLPTDAQWKSEYSASVRRLVRDGVDAPLASLFVHAARTVLPDAEGVGRARSATEAFLYSRLESLPETVGRFALNADLPIPFDGSGRMEVDLLCAEARVAVELDGPQHLGSAEAYRRDRRKDLLLQEQGYLVLRFLTDDVGKELDAVLDSILRALTNRAAKA